MSKEQTAMNRCDTCKHNEYLDNQLIIGWFSCGHPTFTAVAHVATKAVEENGGWKKMPMAVSNSLLFSDYSTEEMMRMVEECECYEAHP